MKKFTGKFRLGGKEYKCEVINGERFVEGKPVEEFFKSLPADIKARLFFVGVEALRDEVKGIKPPKGKYQYLAEDHYK